MAKKVLVVDDEKLIVKGIRFSLEQDGMEVTCAYDGEEALRLAQENKFDMILLDIMLPKMDGFEVCQAIREFSNMPIVMLTAKGDDMDKILGLEYGADDYITKPFSTRELVSRIKAVLRRSSALSGEKPIDVGGLSLDSASQRVSANNKAVDIGPTEYRLLAFFMSHPERAYTRTQLLDQVWGGNVYVEDRTIDVHIRRLRKVLEPFGFADYIQTVRGTGYRFSNKID